MRYTDADQFMTDWIKALRGGKYQQTTEALKTDTGFCCLGVADDISNIGKWHPTHRYTDRFAYRMPSAQFDERHDALAEPIGDLLNVDPEILVSEEIVKKHFDISMLDGSDRDDGDPINVASINDNGATFKDIANILEEWWATVKAERSTA